MTALDIKPETTTSSSPLNLSSLEEEPTVSFSELLKGVNLKKDDKVIQNGAMVLALESEQKVVKENSKSINKDTLLSLLKTDAPLEINPKITQNLSVKELKTLIAGAKEYLKEKILQSDGFKDTQIKELPKTLKGLSALAQKIGIDVSKITIEEVQVKPTKPVLNAELQKATLKEELKSQVQSDVKELKATPKEQVALKEVKTKAAIKVDDKNQAIQIVEDKKIELPKQTPLAKETPLFKAQTPSEHTTEQLVASKQFRVEEKTPKIRADETLKLLLRGEKPSQANPMLTADFSVATARVIAPSATSEATKALESLLHGESSESSNSSKIDGLSTLKSDSFEVKLNEAKQMIKYLSSDVKTAIEDYKSPFTRVKVQLNPQKLGEVDLTIVQRGKNLHISLSSNSAAINTLSMNANELRTQLTNNGINNASLNFNNNSGSDNSSAQQQHQQRQNEQQANQEYSYFNNEETNEEILSSLEIVVPHYA
jgi:hypothetical protein